MHTWFGNEANGYAGGERSRSEKANGRGHPIRVKTWNTWTVCGSIHVERISEVQKCLSGGTEKHLAQYADALSDVFKHLSEDEMSECKRLAEEWNRNQLPEEVQRK